MSLDDLRCPCGRPDCEGAKKWASRQIYMIRSLRYFSIAAFSFAVPWLFDLPFGGEYFPEVGSAILAVGCLLRAGASYCWSNFIEVAATMQRLQ